jgi:hypothetical protein
VRGLLRQDIVERPHAHDADLSVDLADCVTKVGRDGGWLANRSGDEEGGRPGLLRERHVERRLRRPCEPLVLDVPYDTDHRRGHAVALAGRQRQRPTEWIVPEEIASHLGTHDHRSRMNRVIPFVEEAPLQQWNPEGREEVGRGRGGVDQVLGQDAPGRGHVPEGDLDHAPVGRQR